MKEKFRQLPNALQKQILIRGAIGVASLIFFVCILVFTGEINFSLPCLALGAYMIVNAVILLYNCIKDRVVTLQGECSSVERSALRKRIKTVTFTAEKKLLTVTIPHRMRKVAVGDDVTVYLSDKTPVYERDGGYFIYSFHAIEINRKV